MNATYDINTDLISISHKLIPHTNHTLHTHAYIDTFAHIYTDSHYIHPHTNHTLMYAYTHSTYTHFLSECQTSLPEANTVDPWLQLSDISSRHELDYVP